MAHMYLNINAADLRADADACLLNYGTVFHPEIITHARGLYIYTESGHKLLDWTSGQMSCLLGHGNPEIVETIHKHAESLDHLFSGMLSPPVINLAKRLTSLLPEGLDKAFFLSTGGESNEAAIKLAKVFTGKFEIVGLGSSWYVEVYRNVDHEWLLTRYRHGMTASAVGAQYLSGRKGHGPSMPGNLMLPTPNAYRSIFRHADGSYDWKTELDYGFNLVDQASCGSLAAVILEPILSSGGMLELPKGYLRAVKDHCEARGMLLIVDEAQTGVGRAGDMFAIEHEGVTPDILTLSKTLGNGLPLSAVVTSNRVAEKCQSEGFCFYTTHVNDPLPAAVGLKVLDIVVRDNLVEHSKELGVRLQTALRKLQSRYGCIGDVRGRGLMAGMEIVADREKKTPAPELGYALANRMAELGLWAQLSTMPSFGGVFRIAPPITVTEQELNEGLTIMEQAFSETEGSMRLY